MKCILIYNNLEKIFRLEESVMELTKILKGIQNYKTKGETEIDIVSVEDNSKNVKPGSLFIAVSGYDFNRS